MKEEEEKEKYDYNADPVYYCLHCLSLNIVGFEEMEFCDDCGSAAVEQCSIEEWEKLYQDRHNGCRFLDMKFK